MRFTFSQIASLTFLFFSLGLSISFADEEVEPVNKPRIVFLGDSITAGFRLEKSDAYPALIQNLAKQKDIQWNCVNAGLSGDTTNGGVRRAKLLVKRPLDLMVIALGGNDGLRGIAPATTQKNLTAIIETVQKAHPKASIILAGIDVPENMGETYKKEFLATFKTIADEKKVIFYPNLIAGIAGDTKFNQEDMIHPNKEGQKFIAEQLFRTIQNALSKSDKQLTDIRKWYAEVEADKNLMATTFKTGEEEVLQSVKITRYETADGKLRKLHVVGGGEHGESRTTYYFKEGKLLFIYESINEWRFTGEENKDGVAEVIDIASQYRFYFDKGQCFKALEKRVELIDGDELNELLKQKPNKEIQVVAAIQAYHKKAQKLAAIKTQEAFQKYLNQ